MDGSQRVIVGKHLDEVSIPFNFQLIYPDSRLDIGGEIHI